MEMDLPGTLKGMQNPSAAASSKRQKRSAPATIYPEILVIVDYDGYRWAIRFAFFRKKKE